MAALDLTERNQAHFDDVATNVPSPENDFSPMINAIIADFRQRRTWIHPRLETERQNNGSKAEQPLKLLDYACGAGTVSKALLPYTTQIVGLDISAGQVAAYNAWVANEGLSLERANAHQLDLLGSAGGGSHDHGHHHHHHHHNHHHHHHDEHQDQAGISLAGATADNLKDFDVVAISMSLHHVADPAALLTKLAKCLRPGGVCIVLDMVSADEQEQWFNEEAVEERVKGLPEGEGRERLRRAAKTVQTHGFNEAEMRKLMEDAGLGGKTEYVVREEPFVFTMGGLEMKVKAFFARGEKA